MNGNRFFVIEGIDGAGTTTQSKGICQKLNNLYDENVLSVPTLWTHEPTDRPIGQFIRRILKKDISFDGFKEWSPPDEAMALLFSADRVDHIQNFIVPGLERGHVISDRYLHSTLSYQALASKHSLDEIIYWLEIVNNFVVTPDLTIILRVSAEEAARRRNVRGELKEKYEDDALQMQLVEFYGRFPKMNIGNIKFIDGEQAQEKVLSDCMELILPMVR